MKRYERKGKNEVARMSLTMLRRIASEFVAEGKPQMARKTLMALMNEWQNNQDYWNTTIKGLNKAITNLEST